MREPSFVQDPAEGALLAGERRPPERRGRCLGEPARPGAVHFSPVAFEAERGSPPKLEERRRMVAIRAVIAHRVTLLVVVGKVLPRTGQGLVVPAPASPFLTPKGRGL